ncbi:MAG: hypothetical protein ACE5E8_00355 [Acidimicrobiia bacterium]
MHEHPRGRPRFRSLHAAVVSLTLAVPAYADLQRTVTLERPAT